MIEVEIIGSEHAIADAQAPLSLLVDAEVERYSHRGLSGDAGKSGLIAQVLPAQLANLFGLLKSLIPKDPALRVSVNGLEIVVGDIREFSDLLALLSAHGILPKGTKENDS